MEWLLDPTAWVGLATLVLLELVLGIDNLVFLAILSAKLPPGQQDRARLVGLSFALLLRLALLAGISYLAALTAPLFSLGGFAFGARDLLMLAGGLFLLAKATTELHDRLEGGQSQHEGPRGQAGFAAVVVQIVALDAVFSLDSIITAVGMVSELAVMMIAVVIAMAVMLAASRPLTAFVGAHPTVVVLCLGFLLMIGFSLVAEGFHVHVPKGYLYAAIGFSVLIEAFNQTARRNRQRRLAAGRPGLRARTAEAVVRLLGGGREEAGHAGEQVAALVAQAGDDPLLAPAEQRLVEGVLGLAERPVRSLMTPRTELAWLDLDDPPDQLRRQVLAGRHGHYPLARGTVDGLVGLAAAGDLLRDLLEKGAVDPATVKAPVVVPEGASALRVLELLRSSPVHCGVVLDEHGGVEGIVTPTDILEAIAGEFADGGGPHAVRNEDGSWTVDADVDVRELARLMGAAGIVRGAAYGTLAGYVLAALGRLPATGERLERDGWCFEVLGATPRRIERVRITPLGGAPAG